MPKRAILIPVSGLLGHVVRDIYEFAREHLESDFPDKRVWCLGTPFPHAPFPLLAAKKHRARSPEEQALRSWSKMIGFALRFKPAIDDADIVLCKRLGLDIMLYASACAGWNEHKERVMRIHHSLVKNVLVGELGLQIPDCYVIPRAPDGACCEILLETFPQLGEFPDGILEAFVRNQKEVIEEYFHPSTVQNRPLFVDAEKPVEEMYADVVGFIRRKLELYE